MKRIVMLLLVLYPILGIYRLPIGIDIPLNAFSFLILFAFILLSKKRIAFKFPQGFVTYWIYISLVFLLFSGSFRVTLLIPGGLTFCFWVITFIICASFFDYELFRKYYRTVFMICAVAFLFQECCYYVLGSRPIFLLPLPLTGDEPYEVILNNQIVLDRSSCFFREPAHFAQFILPLLAIELMTPSNKDRLFSGFSILLIIILVFLRSGNGFMGLIILMAIRLWNYLKNTKLKSKLITIFISIPLLLAISAIYIRTEQGARIVERATGISTEEGSNGFMRTFRGYYLYADLPTINKIFGTSINEVPNFISRSKVSYLFVSPRTGEPDQYLNGIQTVMVSNGLLGLVLFLFIYFKLYWRNEILPKSLIILFVSLLFISDLYLSQMMIICTLIPWLIKNHPYNIRERFLCGENPYKVFCDKYN